MGKRIEKENIPLTEIMWYAENVKAAVAKLEDQATWLVMSFTLRILEPLEEAITKTKNELEEKHYMKDDKGEYIMRNAPVVDMNGVAMMETVKEGGKDVTKQMTQAVKQFKDIAKYNLELEKLMASTKTVAWEHTIKMGDMAQFPAGLRMLQHKLIDRVILLDNAELAQ